jgi:hypothetical protein
LIIFSSVFARRPIEHDAGNQTDKQNEQIDGHPDRKINRHENAEQNGFDDQPGKK